MKTSEILVGGGVAILALFALKSTTGGGGVNAGDVMNYSATIQAGGLFSNPNSIVSAISAKMQGYGFQVYSSSQSGPGFMQQLEAGFSSTAWTVNFKFSVPEAYAKADDVKSIVNNFVYQETGQLPSASSIADTGQSATEPTPSTSPLGSNPFGGIATALEGAGVGTLIGIAIAAFGIMWLASEKVI